MPNNEEAKKVKKLAESQMIGMKRIALIKNICAAVFVIDILALILELITDNKQYLIVNIILLIVTGVFILIWAWCKKIQKELQEILEGKYSVLITECMEVTHECQEEAQKFTF